MTIFDTLTNKTSNLAGQKKFGFFAGVFTPSILTILGVIMYMRLGWVVGHAGLTGSIVIILIAHVISIATGLSISSIATNKQVGAGGVYYVLSRSLGLPMGGAIGFTLFIATSFSIALYLIGFAENFNPVLGLGSSINDFRVSGTLALLLLTILVYISTSVAIKSQYFILAAIVLSLGAIFLGNTDALPMIGEGGAISSDVSFGVLFGIFFPAVTGFTAGIAMSGDLKDPKKDIPIGTMLAIGAGLVVYLVLAVFLSVNISEGQLQSNYNVLMDIALFAPLVIAGIWGATLSSALGGLLGGPRIFQAMSNDKIAPYSNLFAKGVGKSNEPRNALLLTIAIAEVGVLIGELDSIARLVSMFYLMAYNFINLSFFLESWANSDFSPKFKVSKWVGAIGFLATFTVMFQIDPIAMVLAYVLLFGLYFYLKRKELSLSSGDIWGSVWSSVVKTGLRRMDNMEEHQNYWRPNILLFSGGNDKRPHLIEFSQDLGGRTGVISNFDLIESPDAKVMFPKSEKGIKNSDILSEGIFSRRQEVKDIYTGIETIASIYGFSGIEPNTVLMGWARNTAKPGQFAQLTQSLIELDYNVLYLDYDEKRGYGKYETIDLWWRGISNNVILTIKLVKFLTSSQRWGNARVRVLLVSEDQSERKEIQESIGDLLAEFRLQAEVTVINNSVERLSIFELMKHFSSFTDLVLLGIPDKIRDEETYVANTNNLVDNIGTTLLVRASSQFTETRLGLTPRVKKPENEVVLEEIEPLILDFNPALNRKIEFLEKQLTGVNEKFINGAISSIVSVYNQVIRNYHEKFELFFDAIEERKSIENFRIQFDALKDSLIEINDIQLGGPTEGLMELLEIELQRWSGSRSKILASNNERVTRILSAEELVTLENDNWDVRYIKLLKRTSLKLFGKASISIDWGDMLGFFEASVNLNNQKRLLHDLGMIEALNVKALRNRTVDNIEVLFQELQVQPESRKKLVFESKKEVLDGLIDQMGLIANKPEQLLKIANGRDRKLVMKIVELVGLIDVNEIIEELEEDIDDSSTREVRNLIESYPVFWKRNKELFTNLFKTNLITVGLHIELLSLKDKVGRNVSVEIFGLFRRAAKQLKNLLNNTQDEETRELANFSDSELLSHNPGDFLNKIHEDLRDNIRKLPDSIDLINEQSILNFLDFQEDEVQQINIDLQKVADYYVDLDFMEPLGRRITHAYNKITGRFEDIGARLSYIQELELKKDGGPAQHKELVERLSEDIDVVLELIDEVEVEFMASLNKQSSELRSKLSVTDLLNTSSNPIRYINIKKGYQGVNERWMNFVREGYVWLNKTVFEFNKRRHQLRIAKYNDQNKTLVNKRKQFRDMVTRVKLAHELEEKLPAYFRHLFTGKQVFNKQMTISHEVEMDYAMNVVSQGDGGAALIISEPLGGKSHFAESLIQKINPQNIYRIQPPIFGLREGYTLVNAFNDATGLDGSFFTIMSKLPSNSVIYLNKMERWWLRSSDGGKVIDQIVWLIEKYGHQHQFILSMSIFSYDLIRLVTKLDTVLSATIMVPPMNHKDIAQLMFDRHQLAGVTVAFENNNSPTKREVIKQMEKVSNSSNGNIGVAMHRWLGSAINLNENTVVINSNQSYQLPAILPTTWAMLMTHLILHERLHIDNIYKIFFLQDKSIINNVIKELRYTKLIDEVAKNTYAVNNYVVKSVVEQLKTQKYLKKYE